MILADTGAQASGAGFREDRAVCEGAAGVLQTGSVAARQDAGTCTSVCMHVVCDIQQECGMRMHVK